MKRRSWANGLHSAPYQKWYKSCDFERSFEIDFVRWIDSDRATLSRARKGLPYSLMASIRRDVDVGNKVNDDVG